MGVTVEDLAARHEQNAAANGGSKSSEVKDASEPQLNFLADLRSELSDEDRGAFDVLFANVPVDSVRCSRLIRVALALLGKRANAKKEKK